MQTSLSQKLAGVSFISGAAYWFFSELLKDLFFGMLGSEIKGASMTFNVEATLGLLFQYGPIVVLVAVGIYLLLPSSWKNLGRRKHSREIQTEKKLGTENNLPGDASSDNDDGFVRLKDALIYLAFDTDISVEIKYTSNEAVEKRYASLIGASERVFEMAASEYIDVYAREIILTSNTTSHLTDLKIIPASKCKYIGLRIDHFRVPEKFNEDDYAVEAEESDQSQFESPFDDEEDIDRNVGYWTDIRINMVEVKKIWKQVLGLEM